MSLLSTPRLILASASPRRQDLLREAGYPFIIHPSNVDEDDFPEDISPADLAEALAREKAAVVARLHPDDVVLGADTVVSLNDRMLGKPNDPVHAREILELLSGTTHLVITGVAVIHQAAGFIRHSRIISSVQMRNLSNTEIERYVASNQWMGKAGGYGLQDGDGFPADNPAKSPFVTRLSGSWSNIVGLPMEKTSELLAEAGIFPLSQHRK